MPDPFAIPVGYAKCRCHSDNSFFLDSVYINEEALSPELMNAFKVMTESIRGMQVGLFVVFSGSPLEGKSLRLPDLREGNRIGSLVAFPPDKLSLMRELGKAQGIMVVPMTKDRFDIQYEGEKLFAEINYRTLILHNGELSMTPATPDQVQDTPIQNLEILPFLLPPRPEPTHTRAADHPVYESSLR